MKSTKQQRKREKKVESMDLPTWVGVPNSIVSTKNWLA